MVYAMTRIFIKIVILISGICEETGKSLMLERLGVVPAGISSHSKLSCRQKSSYHTIRVNIVADYPCRLLTYKIQLIY